MDLQNSTSEKRVSWFSLKLHFFFFCTNILLVLATYRRVFALLDFNIEDFSTEHPQRRSATLKNVIIIIRDITYTNTR